MIITALICDNGWTALYAPTGERLAVFSPQTPDTSSVSVTSRHVRADPAVKDFPAVLADRPKGKP